VKSFPNYLVTLVSAWFFFSSHWSLCNSTKPTYTYTPSYTVIAKTIEIGICKKSRFQRFRNLLFMNNFFAKTLSSLNDSRPEAEKAHNQKMHKQLEEKGVEREKERERERER
jgi:hypothetical protein